MISSLSIHYAGAQTVDQDRLQSYIGSKKGAPYQSEQIDNDIKSLYESGLVNEVRVLADPKKSEVEVIFEVKTRPRMSPSPFVGNTVFSDQRLAKETRLPVGRKIDASALDAAAKRIEAFYHAFGYAGTKVSTRAQPSEDGSVDYIFIVEEVPNAR